MKSTPDQTFDTCIKCGKKIRYDKGDGYWDNLTKQKDGTSLWTPFNCVNETTTHEPTNHTPDDKGYYHPIVGKKKIKVSRTDEPMEQKTKACINPLVMESVCDHEMITAPGLGDYCKKCHYGLDML